MAYILKHVTIRTNNTADGIARINNVWQDVISGKLPILFDSNHVFQEGVTLVSKYSNYESDENGAYDFSIMGVSDDFFQAIETKVCTGLYRKYGSCIKIVYG